MTTAREYWDRIAADGPQLERQNGVLFIVPVVGDTEDKPIFTWSPIDPEYVEGITAQPALSLLARDGVEAWLRSEPDAQPDYDNMLTIIVKNGEPA